MLVILYKISVYFRLLGTNDFHAKAKNEKLPQKACRKIICSVYDVFAVADINS